MFHSKPAFVLILVASCSVWVFGRSNALSATLNCNKQDCVEVAFVPDKNGVNTRCLWPAMTKSAYAYSDVYAFIGYGIDQVGGKPDPNTVNGNTRTCSAQSDCAAQGVFPTSGVVSKITGTPTNGPFSNKCKKD